MIINTASHTPPVVRYVNTEFDLATKDLVIISGEKINFSSSAGKFSSVNKSGRISSVEDKLWRKMELTSREYKFLLKSELFENPEKGMKEFWEGIKKIAEEEGFTLQSASSPTMKPPRYIGYLDTPDFALNKSGYTLRRRQKNELKSSSNKYELVLKYRNKDIDVAAKKDVSVAKGIKGEIKFEEDIVAGKETIKNVYSISGKAKLTNEVGYTLGDYGEVYPGLKDLGLPLSTPLTYVNNKKIEEYKMKLGEIDFGGVSGEASITVWYNQGDTSTPVIGEFSFSYDINSAEKPEKINRFVKALQKKMSSQIADGITKTEFIYGKSGEKK
ncbi:MAG TPA: hypothetical protein PL110_01945 [Candidatus Eremiobacteraeota bacterium]|nr:MAG: hypothetical protein BWY64_00545 [bacterium ADurb.Bin363]HPZ06852.1 hypothetical protein [Candidatus Eremiobacteraeota bacterium]